MAVAASADAASPAHRLLQLLKHGLKLAHAMAELQHDEAVQTAVAPAEQSGLAQLCGQGLLLSHDHEQPCAWGLELC